VKAWRLLIVLGLIAALGCGGSTSLRSAKVYYEKNKDYPKAEQFARKAVQEEPQNFQTHLYLALALAQQEKLEEAAVAFADAMRVAPDEEKKEIVSSNQRSFWATYYNKGITAMTTLDYKNAIDLFRKSVAIMPNEAKAHVNLGVSLSNLDRHEEALEAFKKAVEVDPASGDGWRNLGISYHELDDYDAAIEAYTKAIELDPEDAVTLFSLGDMYYNKKDFEKALTYYLQATEKRGDDASLQYQIGSTYFAIENYSDAAQAFRKSAAISQGRSELQDLYHDAMFNLGVTYLKLEEFDAAVGTLQQLVGVAETADLHNMLGAAYSKMGMKDKAMEEFKKADELSGK
jgi:tetratricopeptide (TPR) repeat protein